MFSTSTRIQVTLWGARLGSFLLTRILNSPEDDRLSKFFPAPGELPIKLAGFWAIQVCQCCDATWLT